MDFLSETEFWQPIRLSLQVSVIAVLLVVIIGTLIAAVMAKKTFRGKVLIDTLFMLPLVLPPSVVGFGLLILFGMQSPIGRGIEWFFGQPIVFTLSAAIIAAAVVSFPLMYQTAKIGFESVDHTVEEAARIDGAGHWSLFWHITLPLAFDAILTGGLLAFARALGEFGATLMFAGNIPGKTQTMPTAIYIAVETNDLTRAWAWVATTVVISFLLLAFVYRKKYLKIKS